MKRVYHFTTTKHLPWILASGELRPGRTPGYRVAFPNPDFLWASNDERGDRTATSDCAGYRDGDTLLVRFTLDAARFFPWADARQRHPVWKDEHVEILNRAGRLRGAKPENWFCRIDALPLADVVSIHTKSYRSNRWTEFDGDQMPPREMDGDLWRGVQVGVQR